MLKVISLNALSDNYIWVINQGSQAVVVDPSESEVVLDLFAKQQWNLTAILLTHNHDDHTAGVFALKEKYPDVAIYGSPEVAKWTNHLVSDGQHFELLGYRIEVIASPGHTAEHVSYLMDNELLFCGDALFSGGCGRVFTGDFQAQFATLQRFKALPDFVKVYAGHEYTQSNLRFAEKVLPTSCTLMEYQERADILRSQQKPTLPSTIGIEKQINPFMQAQDVEEFTRLRLLKDQR